MNLDLHSAAVWIQLFDCIPHLIGSNDFYGYTNMKIVSP
jgi:hypothetical protein